MKATSIVRSSTAIQPVDHEQSKAIEDNGLKRLPCLGLDRFRRQALDDLLDRRDHVHGWQVVLVSSRAGFAQ